MFHLFDKIYLSLDNTIDTNKDRVIVSEFYGVPIPEFMKGIPQGDLVAYGSKLDSIIGPDKPYVDVVDFFEKLGSHVSNSDKPLVIYADKNAYSLIVSSWFKTIFSSINVDRGYELIFSSLLHDKLFAPWRYTGRTTYDAYDFNLSHFPSKDEFVMAFNSVSVDSSKAWEFMKNNKFKISIEYLLASYLYNGTFEEELRSSFRNILKRHVEELVTEIKHNIYSNIMRENFQRLAGTGSYNLGNLSAFINDPALGLLSKSNFWNSPVVSQSSSKAGIDFTKITGEELTALEALFKKIHTEADKFSTEAGILKRIGYIQYLRSPSLSKAHLDAVLENEKNSTDSFRFFSSADSEKINRYFIDYVLEVARKNQNGQLSAFMLRV